MLVKDFQLLCDYKTEFPVLKAYFMKHGIPFETSQFNNKMTLVVYSCTELDYSCTELGRSGVLEFTFKEFGW